LSIQAQVGTIDISPIEPCEMGCGDYQKPTNVCRDRLEANFSILHSNESRILLVSVDFLYVGPLLRSDLINLLADEFAENEIFIAASHTHYGPMVDDTKPNMGAVNMQYVNRIAHVIEEGIRKTLKEDRHPIETRHMAYEMSHVINRRRRRKLGAKNKRISFNKVVMLPNFKVNTFPKAHIITLMSEEKIIAVLWQYSCHPTSLPFGVGHSAHFIGEVRRRLRAELGREVPLIYLQGFSGDLRPPAYISKPTSFKEVLEKLIFGPRFRLFKEQEYRDWCSSISEDFLVQFYKLTTSTKKVSMNGHEKIVASRATWPLDEFFEENLSLKREFSIHKIELGNLILLGVSAELISSWEEKFLSIGIDKTLVGVSCIDDTFGYLPDSKSIEEGGYEAGEYCKSFGLPKISNDIEKKFLERITGMLQD
jgi:hypothetical protein